jgi:hypothetical protein
MAEYQQEFDDYLQSSARSDHEREERYQLREALKDGHKWLVQNDYERLAAVVRAAYDALVGDYSPRGFREAAQAAGDREYHARAVRDVVQGELQTTPRNANPGGRTAETITQAFHSAVSLAMSRGLLQTQVTRRADALGYNIKVGEHLQAAEMDFGDTVSAVTRELGALKSFYTGGTAGGKSSGAARQFEDYYRGSVERGEDVKCIDPAGLSAENIAAYDLPQMQDDLRRIRDDQELPEDWREIDGYTPQAEYLVPLTPDLDDYPLPYDTVEQEWVCRPFTIPASALSEELLVAVLQARVSPKEENIIRETYQTVKREIDDFALADLAEEIKGRDDLSESNKKSAYRVLRNLQDKGFIRTQADEHCLDWERLFRSTDVITAFNQTVLRDDLGRLLVIAYLLEEIWAKRIRANDDYPRLAIWLRELWEIVPHDRRKRDRPKPEQAVIDRIRNVLTAIMRKLRDINTYLLADTQEPMDCHKSIRERFNRYIIYSGTTTGTLKEMFEWAGVDGHKSMQRTMMNRAGHAGIINGCEPAVSSSDLYGISPVHLTPPSWNHHDKDEGTNAWDKRVQYTREVDCLDREKLDIVDWDTGIPAELQIDAVETEDTPDVDMTPVVAFADQCLEYNEFEQIPCADVRGGFNAFLQANGRDPWQFNEDHGKVVKFGTKIDEAVERVFGEEIDTAQKTIEGEVTNTYKHVEWSPKGREHLDASRQLSVSSASAPIQGGEG